MAYDSLRQKLTYDNIDPDKKEALLRELEYFNSIAPAGWREKLHFDKDKVQEFIGKHQVGVVIGLFLMIPLLLVLMGIALQFGVIALVIWAIFGRNRGTPEYKQYDFGQNITAPALKLFDDRLRPIYHHDKEDLVDEDMYYDDALVEAHLVRPINKKCRSYTYSGCSYDWDNSANTDAFEFLGYRLYYEYEDSDGDVHTDEFFDGVIFKFRTCFTLNGTDNIMSTETKKTLIGEREKNKFKKIKDRDISVIDTENHEFAESFDTLATYDTEAYNYLTPTMIETLLKLRKDYYICLYMKGNVMTVSLYNTGYKDATKSIISLQKPRHRSTDSVAELDRRLDDYRKAFASIYELKDLLDPDARYAS